MIPTVPFDLILSVFIGLVFAACARAQFASGGAPWGRELAAVLSFEGIIVWPVALYLYLVFPDWSWMYLVDPRRLPWGVTILLLLGYVATIMGGYLGGWALLRARREKVLYGLIAGLGVAMVVMLVALKRRVFSYGTYEDFKLGRALSLSDGKLGYTLGACMLGVATAALVVGFSLNAQGKRAHS